MALRDPLGILATRRNHAQTEPVTPEQVPNAAGGYTFATTDLQRLQRFLVLGTTGGTYYATEQALTKDTGGVVLDLCRTQGRLVVDTVLDISTGGRALRQNPGLFALAAVSALAEDEDARMAAFAAVSAVARTKSTLSQWLAYRLMFGGKGPATERTVRNWLQNRDVADLAYQFVKYRERAGWTTRDLLMLGRPPGGQPGTDRWGLYRWAAGHGDVPLGDYPALAQVAAWERVKGGGDVGAVLEAIADPGLPHEAIPQEMRANPLVWEALLTHDRLPITALLRNLASMTRAGVFRPMTAWSTLVAQRLTDGDRLRRGRVHPMAILLALRTYASGVGERGTSTWVPDPVIVAALDRAYYQAFAYVEPSGLRYLLGLDVSGSMESSYVAGTRMTCREASAAIAMSILAVEEPANVHTLGFSPGAGHQAPQRWGYSVGWNTSSVTSLPLHSGMRLTEAVQAVAGLPFSRTDCSLPMQWALQHQVPVDVFVVVTDNETWHGSMHPHEALRHYRAGMGIDAAMVVVSLTATGNTIADPSDPRQLDIAGLDANVPRILADFGRG